MFIGVLALGMLLGALTSGVALVAGQSFLTALGLYVTVGMLSSGMIALAFQARIKLQRSSTEIA